MERFPRNTRSTLLPVRAVSPEEAAFMLGVGRSSVYKLIKRHSLMARKAGRRTVILTSEIERYLAALPALKTAG